MPSAFGDLSGPGNQQIWINVYRIDQNWGENYTRYAGEVRYYGNGYGSYITSSRFGGWEANFGGFSVGGNFNVPFAERNQQYHSLWAGEFVRYHDSEGWLGGFYASAWIDTDHSSAGDGGASTTEEQPPRIPKPPTAVQNLSVVNITSNSAGVNYSGPADWRGSTWTRYVATWYEIGNGNPVIWTDVNSNGYTSPANGVGPTLKPGQVYQVNIRAESNVGNSPDAWIQFKTLSGAYVWTGASWDPDEVYTWTGSAWTTGETRWWNGTAWVLAS